MGSDTKEEGGKGNIRSTAEVKGKKFTKSSKAPIKSRPRTAAKLS